MALFVYVGWNRYATGCEPVCSHVGMMKTGKIKEVAVRNGNRLCVRNGDSEFSSIINSFPFIGQEF